LHLKEELVLLLVNELLLVRIQRFIKTQLNEEILLMIQVISLI
jgi:hypothetical protein